MEIARRSPRPSSTSSSPSPARSSSSPITRSSTGVAELRPGDDRRAAARAAARLHGAGLFRAARRHADAAQQQGRPQEAAGAARSARFPRQRRPCRAARRRLESASREALGEALKVERVSVDGRFLRRTRRPFAADGAVLLRHPPEPAPSPTSRCATSTCIRTIEDLAAKLGVGRCGTKACRRRAEDIRIPTQSRLLRLRDAAGDLLRRFRRSLALAGRRRRRVDLRSGR